MDLRRTLEKAHELLETAGVSHALIGGFALAIYGQHRATYDIDFLADGTKKDLIKTAFLAGGFSLRFESPEVFQFTGPGYVDILLANRPLSLAMLQQAQENQELGVYVLRPEDIIGLKIQAYKNDPLRELQDKADIQNLLKLPSIDLTLVQKYAEIFEEWEVIRRLSGGRA